MYLENYFSDNLGGQIINCIVLYSVLIKTAQH